MNSVTKRVRLAGRVLYDSLYCKDVPTKQRFGTDCQWYVDTKNLRADSIVYSFGVGTTISFERELISQFGCEIFLYDPSPIGVRTMQLPENHLDGIHFSPVGLSGRSGFYAFNVRRPEEGSFSLIPSNNENCVELECRDLSTLMHENGHAYIDLLKMDIEGAEYDVIEHICDNRLDIRQLCLEFHHFFENIPRVDTRRAIRRLRQNGYQLIHKTRFDHTFIRS